MRLSWGNLGARISLAGDLRLFIVLLNDPVSSPPFDNLLDLGDVMARRDEEPLRMRTNRFVLGGGKGDLGNAARAAALAEDLERVGHVKGNRRRDLLYTFVEVPEESLVARDPRLSLGHLREYRFLVDTLGVRGTSSPRTVERCQAPLTELF
jgi:hypothetical protein